MAVCMKNIIYLHGTPLNKNKSFKERLFTVTEKAKIN